MTAAYVSKGAIGNALTNSLTPSLPASIVAGNYLFLVTDNTAGQTPTTPAGWTLISEQTNAASYKGQAYYKVAGSSESAPNLAFSSSVFVKAQIFQYSGVLGIGAFEDNSQSGTLTEQTCPAITSTANDSIAVYLDTNGHNVTISAPSGWAGHSSDGSSYGAISTGSKSLGASGSSSGSITISDNDCNYYFIWNVELKSAPVPIDADAESSSSASSTSAGGLGISSVAESSGTAATESTYTFAKGAFATSSGIVSGSLSLIFEKAASAISSGILSQETLVGFMANADAVSTGVDASSVAVTRFTFELINTGITITGEVKASRIYYDIGSSSGNITSAVQVLRTMDASVIASALLETGAIGSADYYLIAESLAQMISGIVYVNDYMDGWAYNLNNQAPSFYENFKFNSFAKIGNDYYGLNASGLHIINANDDNGTQIDAVITTGISDFEDDHTKKIQLIYANARTESALELTVRVDNEPEYSYDFISSSAGIAPTRVKLGKGLEGRNWQIEIKNKNGADFEISDLDIPVLPNSRRV